MRVRRSVRGFDNCIDVRGKSFRTFIKDVFIVIAIWVLIDYGQGSSDRAIPLAEIQDGGHAVDDICDDRRTYASLREKGRS